MANTGKRNAATAGRAAEDFALETLSRAGLRLVERNFRCRMGEIDLIMLDGHTLVFVEVRQRSSSRFGTAAESVSGYKQRRLLAAARVFLLRRQLRGVQAQRFDLFGLDGGRAGKDPLVTWRRGIICDPGEYADDG